MNAEAREIWFHRTCSINGVQISKAQLELLEKYVTLLLEWNRKLNLISRRDEQKVWERHIVHSASILFYFSFLKGGRILDLGTGGGLPGIPLKILMPQSSFCLIDSIKKKTVAVANILSKLSLADVKVECGRAEHLGKRKEFVGQFDYVITRGVGDLSEIARWSLPFLGWRSSESEDPVTTGEKMFVPPPALIAMKGGNLDAEIASAWRVKQVKEIFVKDLAILGVSATENPDRKAIVVHFN